MSTQSQISPGMTISVAGKLYRVESAVKVNVAKGTPFIKTKLRNLATEEIIEKNFKPTTEVQEVQISERTLEYLYIEGKNFLFLDIENLETVLVPASVVEDRVHYLKEGTQVKATFYGETVFALELPPFLELMVASTEVPEEASIPVANATKTAILETGARLEVPPFVEAGDILKVDTRTGEYIQRV